MAWMGHRILYKRKCAFMHEDIISFYHPEAPRIIYKQDIWWSDKWDAKEYAKDYDFNKPFFENFKQLLETVPQPSLHTEYVSCVNSDYCNGAFRVKDCYLCFGVNDSENCAYLINMNEHMKECLDAGFSSRCELCYEIVNCHRCYKAFYSVNCEDCQDIYFCRDLAGCANCIGCTNLKNKNYCVWNRQVSKEEFQKTLEGLKLNLRSNVEEFKKKAYDAQLESPRRAVMGLKNSNVSGDYIYNSKNTHNSFMVFSGEGDKYSEFLKPASFDCYDYSFHGVGAEKVYESVWVGNNTNNVKFSFWNYGGQDLEFCFGCHNSKNLFACSSIRGGQFCILNKQFSKDNYFSTVEKIKKQMDSMPHVDKNGRVYKYGEFWPMELCPWTYDESSAGQYIPLTKEDALAQGFSWRKSDHREFIDSTAEPEGDIYEVDESILNEILKCKKCGKNYRLIKREYDFYKRLGIPVPLDCPMCRNEVRLSELNSMDIYERNCERCGQAIQTSYAPDRPEIVYCESCYNQEVA